MTYNVSMGTLNPTIPIPYLSVVKLCVFTVCTHWISVFCNQYMSRGVCILYTHYTHHILMPLLRVVFSILLHTRFMTPIPGQP